MDKFIALIFTIIITQPVLAITIEQQQQVNTELEVAKAEIEIVKSLIPNILRKTLGKNLENADARISNAQKILSSTETTRSYFCTIDSDFDGQFSGRGVSELEAKNDAIISCQRGSRRNGLFCNKKSISCVKEQ